MSRDEKEGCPDDCAACNNPFLDALYNVRTVCAVVAVGAAIVGLIWDVTWMPVWIAGGLWIGLTMGFWAPVPFLKVMVWRRRRESKELQARNQALQQELADLKERTRAARLERIQLEILGSQLKAEIAQKEAYYSALRAEKLEMERLLIQRKVEQEAREARRILEIACAAIEADRLETAAWRMEFTSKQLELKLNQADLFESLSAIEDNAQDRIIAAYEQGFTHGQQGIVIPIKALRHLRVVDESA